MAGFVLTAQLKLAAPSNTSQVVNQIKNQLKGLNVNVGVKVDPRQSQQVNKLNKSIAQTGKTAKQASKDVVDFGKQSALAIRRFSAFVAATFAFRRLASAISDGVKDAIDFEREIFRIAQVTDRSVNSLRGLTAEIGKLSTKFGVSSKELVKVSRVLSQAGLTANQTRISLAALAKSDLAPTFSNISNTAEAAIAIFGQFGTAAEDLEAQLGAINAVAGKFAVEASDISTAIRRTGGAFQAAGGELNELIALFTSVRSTTRESAESIATGFRTIFTRLQRARTISFLGNLGIELKDAEGQFKGPLEAIRALSLALKDLPTTDTRFAQITEELGGFRQISKVIPLIKEFDVTQRALNVAQAGSSSLAKDAEKAQGALAVQIIKVREEFEELIRKMTGTKAFQNFAKIALTLARALIKVADALTPLVGLLATLAIPVVSSKFASFLGKPSGTSGFIPNIVGKHQGGPIGFTKGGRANGVGVTDTVPALLTPGEFVINKKAVDILGADTLAQLNGVKGFAKGGPVGFVSGGAVGAAVSKAGPTGIAIGVAAAALLTLATTTEDVSKSFESVVKGVATAALAFITLKGLIGSISGQKLVGEVNKSLPGTTAAAQEAFKATSTERLKAGTASVEIEEDLRKKQQFSDIATSKKSRSDDKVQQIKTDAIAARQVVVNNIEQTKRDRADSTFGSTNAARSLQDQKLEALRAQRTKIESEAILAHRKELATNKKITQEFFKTRNDRIKAEKEASAASKREVDATLANTKAQKAVSKRGRFGKISPAVAAGVGAAGTFASGFIQQAADKSIASGEGGVGLAGTAGAISGVAQGAAVGSIFGPLGIALGGAVGGLHGFITATKDAETALSAAKFKTVADNLEKTFEDIADGAQPISKLGDIESGLKALKKRFSEVDIDSEAFVDLNGVINKTTLATKNVIDSFKKSSDTIEEFRSAVGESLLSTLAELSGESKNKLLASFKEEIDARAERTKQEKETIQITGIFNSQLRNIVSFSNALQNASDNTKTFSNIISSISSTSVAGPSDRGDILGRGPGANIESFKAIVNSVQKTLGAGSDELGTQAKISQEVISKLPDILLNLRAQNPLGLEGDFTSRLNDEIGKITGKGELGEFIKTAIINRARKIIGDDEKDVNILEAINQDVVKVVAELGGSFENINQIFIKANQASNQVLSEVVKVANRRLQIEQEIVNNAIGIIDLQEQRRKTVAGFGGDTTTNVVAANAADLRRQQTILGSNNAGLANDPAAIGNALIEAQDALIENTIKRNKLEQDGLEGGAALIKTDRELRDEISKLGKGLGFLGDAASRVAPELAKLAEIETVRKEKFGVAEQLAFGGIEQQKSLALAVQAAGAVGPLQQADLSILSDSEKSGLLSFLKSVPTAELGILGGQSGSDALAGIIERFLKRIPGISDDDAKAIAVAGSTTEAKKLQDAVRDGFDRGIKAKEASDKALREEEKSLILLTGNMLSNFAVDLQNSLTESRRGTLESKITESIGLKNQAKEQLRIVNTLEKNFGVNIRSKEELATFRQAASSARDLQGATASEKSLSNFEDRLLGFVSDDFAVANPQSLKDLKAKIPVDSFSLDQNRQITKLFTGDGKSVQASTPQILRILKEAIVAQSERAGDEQSRLTNKFGLTDEAIQKLQDTSKKDLDELLSPLAGANLGGLVAQFKTQEQAIRDNTEALNKLPDILPNIPLDLEKKALGGIISGRGGIDTNLIAATRGEFMIKKSSVDKVGVGILEQINSTGEIPTFQSGGLIGARNSIAKKRRENLKRIKQEIADAKLERNTSDFAPASRADRVQAIINKANSRIATSAQQRKANLLATNERHKTRQRQDRELLGTRPEASPRIQSLLDNARNPPILPQLAPNEPVQQAQNNKAAQNQNNPDRPQQPNKQQGQAPGNLEAVVQTFSNKVDALAEVLETFNGLEIEHTISGTVTVNVNGVEAFNKMDEKFKELVQRDIEFGINKFADENFPKVKKPFSMGED